jgi:DNA-binding winged helix-turn-helix (wHTH) protein
MARAPFAFDRFSLDPAERRLSRDGAPIDLNARYLDALALLVASPGQLVTKDRFMDEVWRGIPVTDEALTQCIKTLRRALGDSASAPRFIETVPKHGYRFIAPLSAAPALPAARPNLRRFILLGGAGVIGGGIAGLLGGLAYGFAGASQPLQPGMGAISILLVLVCLTIVAALIGSLGVAFGIAAADFIPGRRWWAPILGGAAGGLAVGAVARLLGLDAFNLLLGAAPGDITGGGEGALLGAAVGLGASLGRRQPPLARAILPAALATAAAGTLIPLLGGRMMGGSLDLLARTMPHSRLSLDHIGGWFGESGFGPVAQSVTGGIEGLLFGGCIAGAMILAARDLD